MNTEATTGTVVMKYQEKLNELRRLMREAEDFRDIFNYFYEELALSPGFIQDSEQVDDEIAAQLVATAGALNGLQDVLENYPALVLRLKGSDLYHGSILTGGWPIVVIFFEHDNKGIVASSPDGDSHISRFSILGVTGDTIPSKGSTAEN